MYTKDSELKWNANVIQSEHFSGIFIVIRRNILQFSHQKEYCNSLGKKKKERAG